MQSWLFGVVWVVKASILLSGNALWAWSSIFGGMTMAMWIKFESCRCFRRERERQIDRLNNNNNHRVLRLLCDRPWNSSGQCCCRHALGPSKRCAKHSRSSARDHTTLVHVYSSNCWNRVGLPTMDMSVESWLLLHSMWTNLALGRLHESLANWIWGVRGYRSQSASFQFSTHISKLIAIKQTLIGTHGWSIFSSARRNSMADNWRLIQWSLLSVEKVLTLFLRDGSLSSTEQLGESGPFSTLNCVVLLVIF